MIVKEKYTYVIDGSEYEGVICFDDSISKPLPGILVSHQYSGCSKLEERKCEHLADAGFFAFAVDLYGKGIRGKNAEESLKLMNDLCSNRSIISSRINHCLDLLKNHKRVDKNNTAAIGYCFGGKCVLDLARSGAELNLIVSFHGIYDKTNEDSSK